MFVPIVLLHTFLLCVSSAFDSGRANAGEVNGIQDTVTGDQHQPR